MKVTGIWFSPTGGVEKTVRLLAEGMGELTQTVDLAAQDFSKAEAQGDICIIAGPVFGGRIPPTAAQRLLKVQGGGRPAVVMAVYGGRAFEDALAELQDTARQAGFQVVAGVAALAEHSVARGFCTGRPNEQDALVLKGFGEKIAAACAEQKAEPVLPGSRPYKEYKVAPTCPVADESCTKCGLCAVSCPVGAIPAEDPSGMDTGRCIACMRCESVCPVKARKIPAEVSAHINGMLSTLADSSRANELFL